MTAEQEASAGLELRADSKRPCGGPSRATDSRRPLSVKGKSAGLQRPSALPGGVAKGKSNHVCALLLSREVRRGLWRKLREAAHVATAVRGVCSRGVVERAASPPSSASEPGLHALERPVQPSRHSTKMQILVHLVCAGAA